MENSVSLFSVGLWGIGTTHTRAVRVVCGLILVNLITRFVTQEMYISFLVFLPVFCLSMPKCFLVSRA